MGKKTTLKDIAEEVGVSAASVSMILNGKDLSRFTPETVERVLGCAKRCQYAPPSSRNRLKEIAVISPSVNNAYHTTIIMGIDRAALASGYLAHVYNTYWNPHVELQILNMLAKQRVSGIIYLMNPLQKERACEIDRQIPVVAVGDIVSDLGINTVDVNNFKSGEMVAEYLIGLGHRHIAYLTTSLNEHHISRVRRCEGLRSAYARLCPLGSVTVYCKDNSYEQEIRSAEIELDSGRALAQECVQNPKITGIVAINDMVGYGVLDGLLEKGYRVPEDYSLCGFDNAFPSAFHRIGLTTVDHSTEEHGASAFHLLKDRMENRSEKPAAYPITRLEYRSRLIIRDSTGAPRRTET
ncbi:MAG: LacI family transcriptional regulator [Oscillospiraceae bacterium]|nr:LacI family transcriptional regulator [Oscillospiraceae bacterium]